MAKLGLETAIVDRGVYRNTVARFREAGIRLPTFAELADPARIRADVRGSLAGVGPDAPDPHNLFRVHWYNGADRTGMVAVPDHVELPSSLTGVPARIVVAFGDRFPMIGAHKVLAAFGCLAPRVVTGQFDPTRHRAIWPSTGNYCRGGVAISRIMGCRGVAVLPENMSEERFHWLEQWVTERSDIIRTPGSESNVKEIYDACAELEKDEDNVIFNQFCEFGNYLVHRICTGQALTKVFETVTANTPAARLSAYVSASGSAGTLAAGDDLKQKFGTRIVVLEATECPTLLLNGFGEHNIQGIGDKHVPFIHNVMNTDLVVGISDAATDSLYLLANTDEGRAYLAKRHGIDAALLAQFAHLGISGLCNILGAIKAAKYWKLGPDDVIVTMATDGAAMYRTEIPKILAKRYKAGFDAVTCGEVWGRYLAGASTEHVLEPTFTDRNRIFNLGYFTWVEQQGVSLPEFEARRAQRFWDGLLDLVPAWDDQIRAFNAEAGFK